MPYYNVFDRTTGAVKISGSAPSLDDIHLAEGEAIAQADALCLADQCYAYVDGVLTGIGRPPEWGSTWDGARWVAPPPDLVAADIDARAARDQLLAQTVDRINAFWLASMTTEQRAECEAFRQALLDITGQSGYPLNIEWPPVPAILLPAGEGA